MSAGFYHSADLVHWDWHENRQVELYHYAPDARPIGDWLYLCASSKDMPSTIWRTRDPLSDVFEKVSAPFDFWDPALFEDEDGRVYLYWGSSNFEPIRGVEMDPGTMQPVGEKQPVLRGKQECPRLGAVTTTPASARQGCRSRMRSCTGCFLMRRTSPSWKELT